MRAGAACPEPASGPSVCQGLEYARLARELHPDSATPGSLCKRYDVDNSARELHGAPADARILADVYLRDVGGGPLHSPTTTRATRSGTAHGRCACGAYRGPRRCWRPAPRIAGPRGHAGAIHKGERRALVCGRVRARETPGARLPHAPEPQRSSAEPGKGMTAKRRKSRTGWWGWVCRLAAGGGVWQTIRDVGFDVNPPSAWPQLRRGRDLTLESAGGAKAAQLPELHPSGQAHAARCSSSPCYPIDEYKQPISALVRASESVRGAAPRRGGDLRVGPFTRVDTEEVCVPIFEPRRD